MWPYLQDQRIKYLGVGEGTPAYFWTKKFQKLHEYEENWANKLARCRVISILYLKLD